MRLRLRKTTIIRDSRRSVIGTTMLQRLRRPKAMKTKSEVAIRGLKVNHEPKSPLPLSPSKRNVCAPRLLSLMLKIKRWNKTNIVGPTGPHPAVRDAHATHICLQSTPQSARARR